MYGSREGNAVGSLTDGAKKLKKETVKAFVLSFVCGLARFGGVNPAGYAAALSFESNKLAAVLGCFCSSAVTGAVTPSTAAANVFIFAAHKICTRKSKDVPIHVGFIVAVLTAAIVITGVITEDGNGVTGKCAYVALMPLFWLVFRGYSKKNALCDAHLEMALLASAFVAVCAFPQKTYGDVDFRMMAGGLAVLIASKHGGYIYGGLTGLAVGLACNIAAIPAFSIGGLLCGFVYAGGENIACSVFYMAVMAVIGLFSGASSVLPAAINIGVSVIIFGFVRSFVPFGVKKPAPVIALLEAPDDKKDVRNDTPLSSAFSALSSTLMAVSETREQIMKDALYREVSKCVDCVCSKCVGCRTDVADMKLHFVSLIENNEEPSRANVDFHYYIHCRNVDEITAKLRGINIPSVCPEVLKLKSLAGDYMTISKLLENDEQRFYGENTENVALSRAAAAVCRSAGVFAERVSVKGVRSFVIQIYETGKRTSFPDAVVTLLESVCGTRLSTPEITNTRSGAVTELRTVPSIAAEHSHIATAKKGEKVCGDTVAFFESSDMRFYALICDGMGSGKDAALSSRLGTVFLEKMLTAGADKAQAVAMLNKALASAGDEVFTTVDLIEIDTVNSNASILKSGAAPTYIIRNGNIQKIQSHTPPAGIIEDVYAEQTQIKLFAGDRIVMVSDGVSDIPDASTDTELSVAELSLMIADASAKRTNDDMSVVALEILPIPR